MSRSHTRRRAPGAKRRKMLRKTDAVVAAWVAETERIKAHIENQLKGLIGKPLLPVIKNKEELINSVTEAVQAILNKRFGMADDTIRTHIDIQITPNADNPNVLDVRMVPKTDVGETMLLLTKYPDIMSKP